MTAKEKSMAREYPNDAMTAKVKRALKSGRKLRRDADGWLVDAKTGELIGPDPRIERPLTKAQLGKATVRLGRPPKPDRKQSTTLRLDPDVIEYFRKAWSWLADPDGRGIAPRGQAIGAVTDCLENPGKSNFREISQTAEVPGRWAQPGFRHRKS